MFSGKNVGPTRYLPLSVSSSVSLFILNETSCIEVTQ